MSCASSGWMGLGAVAIAGGAPYTCLKGGRLNRRWLRRKETPVSGSEPQKPAQDADRVNVEPLDLNKETVQDLTESEADAVEGGIKIRHPPPTQKLCPTHHGPDCVQPGGPTHAGCG